MEEGVKKGGRRESSEEGGWRREEGFQGEGSPGRRESSEGEEGVQ